MIAEHDSVETIEPNQNFGLPAGAQGAVIYVLGNGAAFDVEFPIPGQEGETMIVTLEAGQVRPSQGKGVALW
jgi:hypothetical protein